MRTGRVCQGYGVKLQWPGSSDGRRSLNTWESHEAQDQWPKLPPVSGKLHFLNTTYVDLDSRMSNALISERVRSLNPPLPTPARSLTFGFEASSSYDDKILISYCKSFLHESSVPNLTET